MELGLRDKVAVLTDIGLAVSNALAAEGTHVVMAARGASQLESEAQRVADAHGVQTLPVACDVATVAGCAALATAAEEPFDGADILFNNAGAGSNETIMEAPDDKHTREPIITLPRRLLATELGC
jgi:3-oxoacyl-[acyl-carrier protein] reductase